MDVKVQTFMITLRWPTKTKTIHNALQLWPEITLSANHNQNYDNALKLIDAAYYAGADAIKLLNSVWFQCWTGNVIFFVIGLVNKTGGGCSKVS